MKNDYAKIKDLIHRIRCNDQDTMMIHLDRTNLGWDINRMDDKVEKNMLHCYMGILSQALRRNSVVHTILLNSNIIASMSNETAKQFFAAVCQLSSLRNIEFYWNRHHELRISWLTHALQHSWNLERLGIYHAKLVGTQNEFQQFCDVLLSLSCTTLRKLICFQIQFPSFVNFGLEDLICDCIAKLPLKSSLQEIQITQSMAGVVGASTCTSSTTKIQKRRYASISEQAIESLCQIQHLQRLTLGGFELGSENLHGIATKLQDTEKSKLQYLNLSGNNLKNEGCLILMNALLNSMSQIQCTKNTVHDDSSSSSDCSTIPTNDNTKSIKSDEEMISYSSSSPLQELLLMNNELGYRSAMAIASVLRDRYCPIKYLNLSNNHTLGDESIQIISDSILNNTTIQKLHLCACNIGNKGIEALTDVIQINQTLQELNIKYNPEIQQEEIEYQNFQAVLKARASTTMSEEVMGGGSRQVELFVCTTDKYASTTTIKSNSNFLLSKVKFYNFMKLARY